MDITDISIIKAALQHDHEQLCTTLDSKEIIIPLLSANVLSREQFQRIEKEGLNHGSIAQARLLLGYLLDQTDEQKLHKFMDVLVEKQTEVHQELQKTINDIANGKIKVEG